MSDSGMVCEVAQQAGRLVAICPEETYVGLITSLPHWWLEITIMALVDGLALAFAWPKAKKWWSKHHSHETCDPKPQVAAPKKRSEEDQWLWDSPRTAEELAAARKASIEHPQVGLPSDTTFTCDGCHLVSKCTLAFDSYNTDGDCLLSK